MANRSHARRAPWLDMLKTGGHSNGSTTSPAPTTKVVTQVVARKLRRGKVWPSESWFPLQITTFELIPACGAKIPRTKMAYETHSLHYLHCQLNIHVIIQQWEEHVLGRLQSSLKTRSISSGGLPNCSPSDPPYRPTPHAVQLSGRPNLNGSP